MILATISKPAYGQLVMGIAIALGTVIAIVLAAIALRYPKKVSLANAPERENSIHPLIVLGILFVWFSIQILLRMACEAFDISKDCKDVAASLITQFLIFAALLFIAKKLFKRGLGSGGLGFARKNIFRDLIFGVILAMASVAICIAIAWAVLELARLISPSYTPKDHRFLEAIDNTSPIWQAAILISAVVGASLSEELIFRGMMQTMLRNFTSPCLAITITSIVFTGVHAEIQNMPSLFVLSVILGWSYEKTGSITLPIFIHAAFNCVMISAKII